jgi:hypothetical protein
MCIFEFILISIFHGVACDAAGRMPFHRSQEDEVARLRMRAIAVGLAGMLREHDSAALHAILHTNKLSDNR